MFCSCLSAIDAAGPLYNDGWNRRVQPTDCELVYAIHTNSAHIGNKATYGTVNVIVNDGTWQDGCPWTRPACSHMRSMIYFIESMRSCKYIMKSNTTTDVFGPRSKNIPGDYHMETSKCYPFCQEESNN